MTDIKDGIINEYGRYDGEKSRALGKLLGERCGDAVWCESLPSTNTVLLDCAKKGFTGSGDVLIASFQSAGRGRLGRSFDSAEGKGLYLSYLFVPKTDEGVKALSSCTAFAAVVLRKVLEEKGGVSCGIKWVNDLVCGSRKVCGILTEGVQDPVTGRITAAVIGVGINVNRKEEEFPEELSDKATSILAESGKETEILSLAADVIRALDSMCAAFPENREWVRAEYGNACVNVGQSVRILKDGSERKGKAIGITDDFALTVLFDDGRIEDVFAGDVSVRGYYGYV